jgi:hypothetical protein
MKCVSQAAAKQEVTVSPQPGPGIGIGGVGQQPICGYRTRGGHEKERS